MLGRKARKESERVNDERALKSNRAEWRGEGGGKREEKLWRSRKLIEQLVRLYELIREDMNERRNKTTGAFEHDTFSF